MNPPTALDVTIQAQILKLMERIQSEIGSSILMITHDLGVIAETVSKVAVMYAGKIVEQTKTENIFITGPNTPTPKGCWTPSRIWTTPSPRTKSSWPFREPCPACWIYPPGAGFRIDADMSWTNAATRNPSCCRPTTAIWSGVGCMTNTPLLKVEGLNKFYPVSVGHWLKRKKALSKPCNR